VSGAATSRAVLALPSVRLLLAGEFLVSLATAATSTALGWQAYARTGDPLTLGLLGLAEFLPAIVLAIPAGHLADRHDRRRVAALGQIGLALVAVGPAIDAALGDTQAWPLYALAAASGTCFAFVAPAYNPLLAAAVPTQQLPPAMALSSLTWQTSTIVGPAFAGLLQLVGDPAPYLLAAAACATAATVVLVVPRSIGVDHHADGERPTLRAALDGIRLIRHSPALLGAVTLDLAAVLFGGVTALVPIFAEDILHVGAVGNGLLRAAPGAGALVVGLALAVRPVRRHVGAKLFGVVAVYGLLTIVFGLSTNFALSLVALSLLAAADMVSVFIRSTLGPLLTPPALRGRVGAVERAFIGASNELGAFESGVAAALVGAAPAVIIGGVLSVLAAVVCAWRFPTLRQVDRFEELEPSRLPSRGP
jgi:MFS family permease